MSSSNRGRRMVGFRFHPTEEELVNHYLKPKALGQGHQVTQLNEINIYDYEPWNLSELSKEKSEEEWYFFCPRTKYANSQRASRTTKAGFWKVTSQDRDIASESSGEVIAIKKSLVFYKGRYANGIRTKWTIHEYNLPSSFPNPREIVLCKLMDNSDETQPEDKSIEPTPTIGCTSKNRNPFENSEFSPISGTNIEEEDPELHAYLQSFKECNEDCNLDAAINTGQSSSYGKFHPL